MGLSPILSAVADIGKVNVSWEEDSGSSPSGEVGVGFSCFALESRHAD